MHQNVVLTIFHTQNIRHHAWKTANFHDVIKGQPLVFEQIMFLKCYSLFLFSMSQNMGYQKFHLVHLDTWSCQKVDKK